MRLSNVFVEMHVSVARLVQQGLAKVRLNIGQ